MSKHVFLCECPDAKATVTEKKKMSCSCLATGLTCMCCRTSEELMLYLGAALGYWRGDIKGLVDDIGMPCTAPLTRCYHTAKVGQKSDVWYVFERCAYPKQRSHGGTALSSAFL